MGNPVVRQRVNPCCPANVANPNVRNAVYPRLLPGNRIEFKIKAPDAKKVQIDLAANTILSAMPTVNGVFFGVTDPSRKVFITIFIIDGISVADPGK